MASRGNISLLFGLLLLLVAFLSSAKEESVDDEHVLTLDHSNFSEIVSQHDFIVIEFYAPWCGHCKKLAPEYEKAASILSRNDPPIILAKVDASDEANKELAAEYKIPGFPTIKILRNAGKTVQEYKGPRESDGIVAYLKRQVGPASVEIKSVEDAGNLIDDKKISIVGVFPALFSGEEYENFTALAEKLRTDYDIGHTAHAEFLPRGEIVNRPTLRLFKPFDELFVDFQDFHLDELEKSIEEASIPVVTIFDNDPNNFEYVDKFLGSSNVKAMLFLNFTTDLDAFKSKYNDVAVVYKGKELSFLLGDIDASRNVFEYFGLKEDQAPLIIILNPNGLKYLKSKVVPDEIAPWLKDYKAGNLKPFIKSEPIPEVNDEPVKVVVTDSLEDVVLNTEKNVLLEFYAPWCGHCKNLAPILDEVATSFEDDHEILIAKFDATANDITNDIFDVRGYPTLYFRSASSNIVKYDGDRTKQDIIDFIEKNRDKPAQVDSSKEGSAKADSAAAMGYLWIKSYCSFSHQLHK